MFTLSNARIDSQLYNQKGNDFDNKGVQASQLVEEGNGLIKVIGSSDESWSFIIKQLKDLSKDRPADLTGLGADGVRYNPQTKQTYQKKLKADKKNYLHTKKTATSLLPPKAGDTPAGRLFAFGTEDQYGIALLFDVKGCDLKEEKYIFKEEAQTFAKWWKNGSVADQRREMYPSYGYSC